MSEVDNNLSADDFGDEIDIREIFSVLIQRKKIIIYITGLLSIIGIIYSVLLPNIYESKALLAPVEEDSSLTGTLSNYSGLAALAGISLPTGTKDSNSVKAIEMMGSLSFFENSLLPKIFLPDLMAIDYWDQKTNSLIYDDEIFDSSSNSWVREYSYPKKLIPSAQESFEAFEEEHFKISENKTSGFITLSVRHQSPFIAKKWVETVVEEINTFYRQKDKSDSEKTVAYLNEQMLKTNLSEVKEVTAELLQREIQKLALVEVNEDYVFEYIYPAIAMEKKSEPSRLLIVIIFTLFGAILSISIVLLSHYFFTEQNEEAERITS
mgnify:FL=1